MFTKNQIIAVVVVGLVVIGGLFYVISTGELSKPKPASSEEEQAALTTEQEVTESFSLAAIVKEVRVEENLLIVTPPNADNEIKVYITEATELVKLVFPFDLANPPAEATFTPERVSITIEDIQVDDSLMLETETNLIGKREINDVAVVQILP